MMVGAVANGMPEPQLLPASRVDVLSVHELISEEGKDKNYKKKKKSKKTSKKKKGNSSEVRDTTVESGHGKLRKQEKKSKKKLKKISKISHNGGQHMEEDTAWFPNVDPHSEAAISEPIRVPDPEGNPIANREGRDGVGIELAGGSTFIEMSVMKVDMNRKRDPRGKESSEHSDDNNSVHSEESSIFSSHPVARKNISYERSSILDDTDSCVGGMIGKSDESVSTFMAGKSNDDMTWCGYSLSSLKDDKEIISIPFEVAAKRSSKTKLKSQQSQFLTPLVSSSYPAFSDPKEKKEDPPMSCDMFENSYMLRDIDASSSMVSSSVKSNPSQATSIDTERTKITSNTVRHVQNKKRKPDPIAVKLVEAQRVKTSGIPSRQANGARYSGSSGVSSIPSSASSDHPAFRDELVSYLRSMGTSKRTAIHLTATFREQQQEQQPCLEQTLQMPPLQDQQSQESQQQEDGHVCTRTDPLNSGSIPSEPPTRGRRSSIRGVAGSRQRRRCREATGFSFERALQPGAVPMEGRAFGAPRRPTSPSIEPFHHSSFAGTALPAMGLDGGLGLIQATAVKDDLPSPVIYADGTPISWKDLLKEKPIRHRLYALVVFGVAVVVISVSAVVFSRDQGTLSNSESYITPTLAPSSSPTMIKADMLEYVTRISGIEAMNNTESPQFKALGWLSTFDVLTERLDEMFEQRYAMVTLFYATHGDMWFEKDDWLSPDMDVCDWSEAISCKVDGTGRRLVNGLDLTRNGLDGFLPNEVGLPRQIEFLRFPKNKISSSLPSSIFNLPNLAVLDLSTNLLTGKIPSTLGGGKALVQLDISYNRLTGTIPTELFSLVLLRTIDLHHNELTGTIDGALKDLKVLSKLGVSNNLLTGLIPNFNKSPALDIVDVGSNLISGTIPSWFTELMTRQELLVNDNLLEGTIPSIPLETAAAFVSNPDAVNLVRLRKVNGADNQLTGTLPFWAGFLPTLQYFDITNNKFTGTIPLNSYQGGSQWESLETIRLGNNLLTGTLSTVLPPKMIEVDFSKNRLSGSIPDNYAAATSLQYLILDDNPNLSCDVAVLLKSARNLNSLGVSGTNITGRISGEDVKSLSKNMEILNLSNNTITGTLPTELGMVQSLKKLFLHSNALTGTIPTEIGLLEDLRTLELNTNNLSGELPQELSNLGSLEVLTLFNNPEMSGTIPNPFCQIRTNLTVVVIGCEIGCSCCIPHNDSSLCSTPVGGGGDDDLGVISSPIPKVGTAALSRSSNSSNIFDGDARRGLRGY